MKYDQNGRRPLSLDDTAPAEIDRKGNVYWHGQRLNLTGWQKFGASAGIASAFVSAGCALWTVFHPHHRW